MLAWKRVAREVAEGTLGGEFDKNDRAELQSKVKDAEEAAKDEVWGDYRFAVVADSQEADGLKVIDLGAGPFVERRDALRPSASAPSSQRALLNESVGAGYIDRNWPPALKDSGAWPLASLRQSFLNGSLTRLVDPDATLKSQDRRVRARGISVSLRERRPKEPTSECGSRRCLPRTRWPSMPAVFLLRKATAESLKTGTPASPTQTSKPEPGPSATERKPEPGPTPSPEPDLAASTRTLRLVGTIPPEVWNRLGTKILPKLRSGSDLKIGLDFL